MHPIKRTFGENLIHFVRSIDIVDSETKDSLLSLVQSYLLEELGIKFFTFQVESIVNDRIGLRTTDWHRGGERSSFTIKDDKSNYQGQVSLSYDQRKPLWIVTADKQELRVSKKYIDLWSKTDNEEIPEYVKRTDAPILTSIIIPLRDDEKRVFGTINFESIRYLEFSDSVKEELSHISDSISTLYSLNKTHANQKRNTKKELDYLSDLKANKGALLKVSKPKLFLASPNLCNDDVMASIKELLDNYSQKIELVHWKDISASGIITQQILRIISTCQYGVCYFSERVENEAEISYKDNKNVLIEAGMLSTYSNGADFENWIPIREKQSEKIPFDFAGNRMLIVPRNKSGQLNEEKFRQELDARLSNWIDLS